MQRPLRLLVPESLRHNWTIRQSGSRLITECGLAASHEPKSQAGNSRSILKGCHPTTRSPEAGIAHRSYGMTRWFQGDFVGAREHVEQVLTIYDHDRDRELAFKFGQTLALRQ